MSWLDVVILVVAFVIAIVGWRIGIVRVAVLLAAILVGIYLSGQFHGDVAVALSPFIENENVASVAAFVVIFAVVFIGAVIVSSIFRKILSLLMLGWADRLAGLALGVFVVLAIFSALLSLVQQYPILGFEDTIQRSPLGSFLANRFDVLLRFLRLLPKEFGIQE